MRKHIWASALIISSLYFNVSCKKEQPTNLPPPEFPNITNTAPKAYAGQDIWVILPATSCKLKASAIDGENNVSNYIWKKVDGPLSYDIISANAHETEVTKLEKGSYAFEVQVTDKGGLSSKDTVMVFVREPAAPGNGEFIFKDLNWGCAFGCFLQIDCLTCFMSANQNFKAFLRRDTTNQWVEIISDNSAMNNDKYIYGISNNSIWILGILESDEEAESPDVMIKF